MGVIKKFKEGRCRGLGIRLSEFLCLIYSSEFLCLITSDYDDSEIRARTNTTDLGKRIARQVALGGTHRSQNSWPMDKKLSSGVCESKDAETYLQQNEATT